MAVHVSAIDDTDEKANKIPFLAGRDLLKVLGTIIDVEDSTVVFKKLSDQKCETTPTTNSHMGIDLGAGLAEILERRIETPFHRRISY